MVPTPCQVATPSLSVTVVSVDVAVLRCDREGDLLVGLESVHLYYHATIRVITVGSDHELIDGDFYVVVAAVFLRFDCGLAHDAPGGDTVLGCGFGLSEDFELIVFWGDGEVDLLVSFQSFDLQQHAAFGVITVGAAMKFRG